MKLFTKLAIVGLTLSSSLGFAFHHTPVGHVVYCEAHLTGKLKAEIPAGLDNLGKATLARPAGNVESLSSYTAVALNGQSQFFRVQGWQEEPTDGVQYERFNTRKKRAEVEAACQRGLQTHIEHLRNIAPEEFADFENDYEGFAISPTIRSFVIISEDKLELIHK